MKRFPRISIYLINTILFIFGLAVPCRAQVKPAATHATATTTLPAATDSYATEPVILEPAGAVPGIVRISVTGRNVTKDLYLPLAYQAIRERIRIQTGAKYDIDVSKARGAVPLNPGDVVLAQVPVTITLAGYQTVQAYVPAEVENIRVEGFAPTEKIFVSNSPETLKRGGELLSDTLPRGSSARFIVHHKNGTRRKLNFVFIVENPSDQPVMLRMVGNIMNPDSNEMAVGHRAAVEFIRALSADAGYLVEVPPRGFVTLKKIEMAPNRIVSGLCELQLLRGGNLSFSIRVLEPYMSDRISGRDIGDVSTNRAHGIYGAPLIRYQETYEVGGKWRFINVGEDPLPAISLQSPPLNGNYGVTYDVFVNVKNPLTTPETIDIVFAPAGGLAMGTFLIDDVFYISKKIRPPDTANIYSFKIGPNQVRQIRFMTIPESGSFYPVRIIFKSRRSISGVRSKPVNTAVTETAAPAAETRNR